MRKAITMILVAALMISVTACGGGGNDSNNEPTDTPTTQGETTPESQTQELAIGNTAATDIVELTLDQAELAIALHNGSDYANLFYLTPKEYNAEKDSQNPFVAPKGHTLIPMTITMSNIDRAGSIDLSEDLCDEVIYKEEAYPTSVKIQRRLESDDKIEWENKNASNILIPQAATKTMRLYVDLPVEADSLSDDFKVKFNLPNSDGTTTAFIYAISEADRLALVAEKPIDKELQGSWNNPNSDFGITFTSAKIPPIDGTFTTTERNRGIYQIGDEKIKLMYVNSDSTLSDRSFEIEYTFENEELVLIGEYGSGEEFHYVKE